MPRVLLPLICTRSFGKNSLLIFPTLRVHIKENNNWRHGKFHRFLFHFLANFLDLNFAPYVLYIYSCYLKPVRDTNTAPGLPVLKSALHSNVKRSGY